MRTARVAKGSFAVATLLLASSTATVSAQSTTVDGSLDAGPTGQGSCTASGSDAFLCSNGAFCTWAAASSSFSCVGGTGTVNEATSSSSAGPPASVCPEGTLHEGHWDCANGAFCEEVDGAWVCEGGSHEGEEHSDEAGGASGSACVVHGGHTHGDCSDQCNGVDLGEYDLDLHVVALFMVLVSSLIGVLLPLLCSKALHGTVFSAIFFGAKHFGTGVIISTAFVHLLYHAFIMFGNTCLGELAFEPAAAAIAMAGTYLVFGIDFCVMRWLKTRGKSCASTLNEDEDEKRTTDLGHYHGPSRLVHTDYASPQAHADVTILEAGIIFHSIMIGVSLGASGGSQWVPLFIAVVFHQMFEGLALGSRIGQLVWTDGRGWKRWVMAGTFGLITPIGVAIGIGVHSAYNPNSGAALLSIGVLDSISAGILIYAGLVEMLAHDFMHGELSHARAPKVVAAFFFLLAGSLCMSVLGKWA